MKDSPRPVQEAVKEFDRETERQATELAEQEREEAVSRFPLDAWPTMPLERYALGLGNKRDSFCWWMEFGTPHVGSMKGGNARKHIIYRQNDGEWWYFDRQIYKTVEDAWNVVRAGFVRAFEKANAGDFDGVDQIDGIRWGPALRTKSLYCYFPDRFLPITSIAHIRHYLRLLGSPLAGEGGYEVVRLNRALLDTLRRTPGVDGWSTWELAHFLYGWADPRDQRRVVKIAPGEDARFWPECLQRGYVRVGWGKVGDLRRFESKEAFRARFEQEYGSSYNNHRPTISKKANEVWTLRELEPGDFIVANRGTSKVLAVGEVVEPGYEWSDGEADYNNIVHVEWNTAYAQDIPPQKRWALETVAPVPEALAAQILKKRPGLPPDIAPDPILKQVAEALQWKGQAVLYGPPGTGKTYAARRFAVWWLTRQLGGDPAQLLTDREAFDAAEKRLSTGQVGSLTWLTFHPSYSYEDFIEGFRPVDATGGQLSLRLEDGVLKRVCREAQANPKRPYLVLIDEINRANVAKVLGELVTLLEKDKRGLMISLPQSKEAFTIPPNVYLLGTMNTADRSIKLLDAALRRRFAFLELMPDPTLLEGGKVGNLPLDEFLRELNRRVAKREGREKQIGHSFLLHGGEPVADVEEFARRFRQEILPLLQEYCYDDYASLAEYIGEALVDKEGQTLDDEVLSDAESLVVALEKEFAAKEATA